MCNQTVTLMPRRPRQPAKTEWTSDPQSTDFAAEVRRQAGLIAESPHEKEDQAFIDSISEWKPGRNATKLGYRIGRLDDEDATRLDRALMIHLGLAR
jgi:sulfite reductase beta subunit-like hemoprotein